MGSATRLPDVAAEGILLAGGGRAILLQLAHPAVGRGVAEHSDFAHRPMSRLHGTLSYVYALSHGSPEDVAAMRAAVDRAHGRVAGAASAAGPAYDARDPDLQLWVAATLYDSSIRVYERVFGALAPDVAEQVYRDYARLGTTLQLPPGAWPDDRAAFERYWRRTLPTLVVTPAAREVQRTLFAARAAPAATRPLLPLARFVTTALLPSPVRTGFGLPWSAAHQRRFDRLCAAAIPAYRLLPARIRSLPSRRYLARLRRHVAAGAAAGETTDRG